MKSVIKFFSEARNELMKVSWPTTSTAITLTLTVLGVSLVFAVFITVADLAITEGVKWITEKSQEQSGPRNIQVPNIDLSDIQATPVN